MRSSPLYAMLCFQLAFAPAALAAQPTWEAKRAHMAKEIKEALKSLDELDRTGPLCSDNYLKSQCPSVMPPPKQTFVETAKKNLKALEREVAGIAPEAKIADQPFDPKKLAGVDGCSGAGTSAAADAAKRKAAVDKMNTVFANVSKSISSDLGKLFEGGPSFKAKAKACINESDLNVFKKAAASALLPEYPHGALDYMWTPDSAHKSCPRSGVETFRKLTGSKKGDGNAQLVRLAGNGREFAANLAKSSADLANHTKVASKVDCNSAVKLASDERKTPETPAPQPEPPADTPPPSSDPAPDATADTPPPSPDPAPDATADTPPPSPDPAPVPAPSEQKTTLSKGHAIAGLAILGVGAGAAYLIFKGKNKKSETPYSPTVTQTNTGTQTNTDTNSGTGTGTSTATRTSYDPISSVPYTGTLTSTSTATQTATDTSTVTSTSTESETSTQTSTSTSTATRE